MSAFIVEPKTINRIITYLENEIIHRQNYMVARRLTKAGVDFKYKDWKSRLAVRMHNLNVRAVNDRYDEKLDKNPLVSFSEEWVTTTQAYKSLKCWLYQCTEGTCDRTRLYKQLYEISRDIAEFLLHSRSEFEKGEWA